MRRRKFRHRRKSNPDSPQMVGPGGVELHGVSATQELDGLDTAAKGNVAGHDQPPLVEIGGGETEENRRVYEM